jgi:hypothetical protein
VQGADSHDRRPTVTPVTVNWNAVGSPLDGLDDVVPRCAEELGSDGNWLISGLLVRKCVDVQRRQRMDEST